MFLVLHWNLYLSNFFSVNLSQQPSLIRMGFPLLQELFCDFYSPLYRLDILVFSPSSTDSTETRPKIFYAGLSSCKKTNNVLLLIFVMSNHVSCVSLTFCQIWNNSRILKLLLVSLWIMNWVFKMLMDPRFVPNRYKSQCSFSISISVPLQLLGHRVLERKVLSY